jgi:hypothetical protein
LPQDELPGQPDDPQWQHQPDNRSCLGLAVAGRQRTVYGRATDPSKFFLLTSASEIVTTFNAIGTNISKLRVAM